MESLQMVSNRLLWLIYAGGALVAPPLAALEIGLPQQEIVRGDGSVPTGPCVSGWPSRDGRFIAFTCAFDDIVLGDGNSVGDTFLLDRQSRQIIRVSLDSTEAEYGFSSGGGIPSDDGQAVAFTSTAPLDPVLDFPYFDESWSNAFLRDLVAGTTTLIGRDVSGSYAQPSGSTQLLDANFPLRLVLFASDSNMIGTGAIPGPARQNLYLRNWQTGAVELVSATPAGQFAEFGSTAAAISANGRYVVFVSSASDLGPPNPGNGIQLMLRDRQTRTTRRLSYPQNGGEFGPSGYYQARVGEITGDGRFVAVQATSDELAPGSAPGLPNIYTIDTQTGRYELVSRGHQGQVPDNGSYEATISEDGRFIAFYSRATNLLPNALANSIYVEDRWTRELVNVSQSLGPAPATFIPNLRLSGDGSLLVFDWQHSPDHPTLAGRSLIYSVSVRGRPIAGALPVPLLGPYSWVLLSLALLCLGIVGQNAPGRSGELLPASVQ